MHRTISFAKLKRAAVASVLFAIAVSPALAQGRAQGSSPRPRDPG